jgi:uncharacterized Zn finger protein (UPF0148 family)
MTNFHCPLCGAMLTSKDASPMIYCPHCGNTVVVPPAAQGANDPLAASPPPSTPNEPGWLGEVHAELERGNKIAAIKLYLEATGSGLREAKEAVDAIEEGRTPPPEHNRRPS